MRSRQRSLAGVACWTLHGLALEILARAGEAPPVGSKMLPILVRRAARRQRPLRDCLDHLNDGYASLVSTVTDLLEAGLDPAHGEAIEEALVTEGRSVATDAEVQRARSLVRVAIAVQEEMNELGLAPVSILTQRATELLTTDPELPMHSSGFHVHGFADATGVATDLIEAALKRFGGTVYLDRPPDPLQPREIDPSVVFSRRFSERLEALGRVDEDLTPGPDPAIPKLVSALGAQAEVREIGWRIRRLLDAGTRPEEIAVVARQPEPYRSAIRIHFQRLGIPYSALGTSGPQLPTSRQIRALLEIIARRKQVRLDRWLDARNTGSSPVPIFDLRLALFGLGVARLEEFADLPLDGVLQRETYPLPVRSGFSTDDEADSGVRLHRRRVPTEVIRQARDAADELCKLLSSWAECRLWSEHVERFEKLLTLLDWTLERDPIEVVQAAIERLARGFPATLKLDLDEMTLLLTDALGSAGLDRFGGKGGGVQILDVIESRGRTFEHLFLLGMNKGVFPRTVREDPALPDPLRQVLGHEGHGVLPDLPRKRAGYAEERFLFAQLVSSSPHVTLSWQLADDDNKEVTPSPLVERLLGSMAATSVKSPTSTKPSQDPGSPHTAYERAIQAALSDSRRHLKGAFVAAIPRAQAGVALELAQARFRIVDELNRPAGDGSRLGPYFGLVGTATEPNDPRLAQKLYITTLERFAGCPWRTFLERVLRLESLPDPIEVLPGLDPLLIGQLVHRILEHLLRDGLREVPAALEDARSLDPVAIAWPKKRELHRIVRQEAVTVARDQGIAWEGFAVVLAQVVLPYLDQARALLWEAQDGAQPVAVEMDCSLGVRSGSSIRPIHFKADRVDLEDGRLLVSDYKTGRRGVSSAKKQDTRDRHLLAEIRQGHLLQAAAYARASGGTDDLGRYVYVRPDFTGLEETRIVAIAADNEKAKAAFDDAIDTLLRAWDAGVFFPRLIEADTDREPRACDRCAMAEACLRGDSGARARLRDWTSARHLEGPTQQIFTNAWHLDSKRNQQA